MYIMVSNIQICCILYSTNSASLIKYWVKCHL